jgi:hypothetical protein
MPTSAHAQTMKPAVHMSPRRGNVSVPNRAAHTADVAGMLWNRSRTGLV